MLGREGAPWYVWVSQNHTSHKGGPLMKQAYIISQGMEEFASAREQFALIVDRLQSAAVLGMNMAKGKGVDPPLTLESMS